MRILALLRIAGLTGIAIAAVVVTVFTKQTPASIPRIDLPAFSSSIDEDVSSALQAAESNESTADSAPQQSVVNGWATKDLLAALGRELGSMHKDELAIAGARAEQLTQADLPQRDNRPAVLLCLVVAAIAWWGILDAIGTYVRGRPVRVVQMNPDPRTGNLPTTLPPMPYQSDGWNGIVPTYPQVPDQPTG